MEKKIIREQIMVLAFLGLLCGAVQVPEAPFLE